MYNSFMPFAPGMPVAGYMSSGLTVALLVIWSLIWKGQALWKSARLGKKWWFVALLLLNTAGILDILYLYVFSKRNETSAGQAGVGSHK